VLESRVLRGTVGARREGEKGGLRKFREWGASWLVLPIKYHKNGWMTEDKMSGACGLFTFYVRIYYTNQ
jgi:hypothetical protein